MSAESLLSGLTHIHTREEFTKKLSDQIMAAIASLKVNSH
jgi:hypothetical protein